MAAFSKETKVQENNNVSFWKIPQSRNQEKNTVESKKTLITMPEF